MLGFFKKYVNKRVELLKLELTERTSDLISILIVFFIILTVLMMFLFLFSLGIGIFIGQRLNNTGLGILIFSCFYLLIFILFLIFYKKIKKYTMRKIIEFQLNREEDEEDDKDQW